MAKVTFSKKETNNSDYKMTVKEASYTKKHKNNKKFLIASIILNIASISYIILTTI